PDGNIYFSVPSTGEIYQLRNGNQTLFFRRNIKNVGPIAFAPNGTLFIAEMTASEGSQSIYKLTQTPSGNMTETIVFKTPHSIGGIAFNSKGELFYSDGQRGRLWKIVNGTPELYVNKKTWATMYGIVFDALDNIYLCDWSTPGNIYYVDFRLNLTYKISSSNGTPLNEAKVSIKLPNSTQLTLTTNSTGHISINQTLPGTHQLQVYWQNLTVGNFEFTELTRGNKNLTCNVFDIKLTATDSLNRPLNSITLNIHLPNGTIITTTSPASLPLTPTGTLKVTATYNNKQVATPLTINLTSNLDTNIPCSIHSLTIQIIDPNMEPLTDSLLEVRNENSTITTQKSTTANFTINDLTDGKYTISAKIGGFQVAQTELLLNTSQTIQLKANVSEVVLTATDLFGFPIEGARVTITLPDNSTFTGKTNENGKFSLKQLPIVNIKVSVDSGNEKRELTLDLNNTKTEATTTFFLSFAMNITIIALIIATLLFIPKTRRAIIKSIRSIKIEISSENENFINWYLNSLSSATGLNIEEAKQIKSGQTNLLIEGNTLPNLKDTTDHTVLLVADNTVMPKRKEIRVLKEVVNLKEDLNTLSKLVQTYSQETKLPTLGILLCDEVTEDMLSTLKKSTDTEVVLMPKKQT
ncbi:MAG: hypothetical protein N3D85_06660, partial [Candidatus Bathyarchaeota archaeon]|nr:hypothetical protein [Candidatus Bathyarchaeota archaeon]